MPSKSQAEHNFWGMVKHDPAIAREKGIKPGVAQDFLNADEGGPFDRGDYHHEVHKKGKPAGRWHNQHTGHPKGA